MELSARAGILGGLFAAGLALLVAYAWVTPFDARTQDLPSHLRYVSLVQQRHAVPAARECWECHQPPGYYVLAAVALAASGCTVPPADAKSGAPGARVLRGLGVAIGAATLGAWFLAIRLLLATNYERGLACAWVAFWPTFVTNACRVGNESLLYLFAAVTLHQLVRWRRTGRASALCAAAVAAGASLQAKLTGMVLVAVVAASLLAAAWRAPRAGGRRWPRGSAPAAALLAALVGFWAFGVWHWKQGVLGTDFNGMGNLAVANSWKQYVTFDPATFRPDPFAHAGGGHGRDQFWNYLLRSSLFGEFLSDRPATKAFAYALVALALVFLPFVVAGLARSIAAGLRRDDRGWRELALTLLGFLGFLVVLRARYPFAPHNDFRFIVPVVVPCAVMAASSFGRLRRRLPGRWRAASAIAPCLVAAFCAASTRILLVWP